jgi:NADH:ubiquinone reductase (non-electrogenic)
LLQSVDNMQATRVLHQAIRPRAVLLGSGWGAFAVAKELRDRFDVTFVSPRNHMLFTPLLPSAASGVLNLRSISEPIKHSFPTAAYELAMATAVDPVKKTVTITTPRLGPKAREERDAMTATLPYDVLVIGCGATNNTFSIAGVETHAYYMRSLTDARDVRKHLIRNVEAATFPGLSNRERRRLLSVVIAGGGPTGVELAAELHDLLQQDILKMYPQLRAEVSITIIEGRGLLGGFDASLREFTMRKFARDRIRIQLGANVTAVHAHKVDLSDGDEVPYGLLVWNTGLSPQPLVAGLDPALWRKDAWGHLVRGRDRRAGEAERHGLVCSGTTLFLTPFV